MPKRKHNFYGVRVGHNTGVYENWEDCKRQVMGFPGNQYKGFSTRSEAEKYVDEIVRCLPMSANPKSSSSQSLQTSKFSQSEPFKLIEEHGQQFVVFESITDFDMYFDGFCGRSNDVEYGQTSKILYKSEDSQSEREGEFCVKETTSETKLMKEDGDFVYFKDESVLERYLASYFKVDVESDGLKHDVEPDSLKDDVEPDSLKLALAFQSFFGTEWENNVRRLLKGSGLTFSPILLHLQGVFQVEFDGASKGNPGKAGAGALLRCPHGHVVLELVESLGTATNNVAEYRSLILGLKGALSKGVRKVKAQGDSKLVCLQVLDVWKVKEKGLIKLRDNVKELKDQFEQFAIMHVEREFNSAADALANNAVYLADIKSEPTREMFSPIPKCCKC